MDERRKEKRYLYQTSLKYEGNGEYHQFNAVSMNMSADGISILSDINMDLGETFSLKFKLMDRDEPICANCEVIYCKPKDDKHLIGCKIKEIQGISRDELKKILDDLFKEMDI
ncbi:MAG: PilZ domain-containing protein [Acidobacteria bacterium]|nr:PilZ domain-containing protein [Acidobacteriota bacterium]